MSNKNWLTGRPIEPLEHGNSVTLKVETYCQLWMDRAYSNGIPDSLPSKLSRSGRAPSYKAIAMAILKNDLNFYSLGFPEKESRYFRQLKDAKKKADSPQLDLF